MAITFPATPVVGSSIYYGGRQWTYDGSEWNLAIGNASQFRWSYSAVGGETSVSGASNLGSNTGVTLSYTVGNEEVYYNGVLLVRGSDYTAVNGATITFVGFTLSYGDVIDLINYSTLNTSSSSGGASALVTAKGDLSVGQVANVAQALHVGADGTILAADSTQALGMGWQDYTITPLDNLRYKFDGYTTVFTPTYQGVPITITNPNRLLITINGIIQTVNFPRYAFQSPMTWDGFMVDSNGNLSFSEAPPAGSTFIGVIQAGSNIVNYPNYPFSAQEILLGA